MSHGNHGGHGGGGHHMGGTFIATYLLYKFKPLALLLLLMVLWGL